VTLSNDVVAKFSGVLRSPVSPMTRCGRGSHIRGIGISVAFYASGVPFRLIAEQKIRGARRRIKGAYAGRFGRVPTPDKWVFIVGTYNSGTTLLHRILATHPDVGVLPSEGHFLTTELATPRSHRLRRLWALKPELFYLDENSNAPIDVLKLKRQWGIHFNDVTKPVLVEKTPVNAARTRWLQKHFERAHFIGMVRNGYAVAEGIRRKEGHPIDIAARVWARSNEIMLRDFEKLEHRILIRYEDLTESFEASMNQVWSLLELDPPNESFADRTWQIHEKYSRITNMNGSSFAALTDEDRRRIKASAGDMLVGLGYRWGGS
jgi:hypothetical protein